MSQLQQLVLSLSQFQLLSSSIILSTTNRQSIRRTSYSMATTTATTTLLLLLLLSPSTLAQSSNMSSPISNGCLSLSMSKSCYSFRNYYVGVPALARYGLNTMFDTIDAFDQAVDDYTTSTRSYIAQLECYNSTDLALFNRNSTTTFPYARYSKSRFCASLVQDSDSSLPCNYNYSIAPPPLCKSTCLQWLNSVNTTIYDPKSNACPNAFIDPPVINSLFQIMSSSCNDWGGLNGTPGSCINGEQNEPDNCGFSNTTSDACIYCQQNSNDPCCRNLTTSCSNGILSVGAIIGIVIGSVVVLVMVGLGLFFFCCKRQNKRIRKENSFSFKTYIAPHRQQQQQGQQQYAMDNDHYSGNKVLLQNDYYNGGDDDNHQHHQHSSVGMIGTQSTQNTYKSQLSDPFGDHYEVISLANNTNNNNLPTTITPISSNSTFAANGTLDVVLPLVSLDDPQKEDSGVGVGGNGDEPAYEEEFYQVVHPYPPQVADELGLQVGDIVCLAIGFDDGWALGFNVTTGSKGVFPLVCVSLIPPSVLEQLLTSSTSNNNNNNNSNNGEDPMVDGLSTFSSKVLVEEDDSTQEQYHHQQDQQQNQRRLSRSSQLAISIRRIREDMRRSLSLSSSTASYSRHPSPLSAKGSISSKSIRPSSPSPSQAVTTTDIPRRTASMVRSSNNNTTIEYAECESPTSPTHQTPLFNGSNHHLQQQQQQQGSESCEMYHHNHNRLSKQES